MLIILMIFYYQSQIAFNYASSYFIIIDLRFRQLLNLDNTVCADSVYGIVNIVFKNTTLRNNVRRKVSELI